MKLNSGGTYADLYPPPAHPQTLNYISLWPAENIHAHFQQLGTLENLKISFRERKMISGREKPAGEKKGKSGRYAEPAD